MNAVAKNGFCLYVRGDRTQHLERLAGTSAAIIAYVCVNMLKPITYLMKSLAFACCIYALCPAVAQAQTWKWAQRHGGDSVEATGFHGMPDPFQERKQGWNSVV